MVINIIMYSNIFIYVFPPYLRVYFEIFVKFTFHTSLKLILINMINNMINMINNTLMYYIIYICSIIINNNIYY